MYSKIYYEPEVTDENIDTIINDVENGIKVYFFTPTPFDFVQSPLLQTAKEYSILQVFTLPSDSWYQGNRFCFENGNIPQEQLTELSKAFETFNMEQYLIEHSPIDENILVNAGAGTGKTTVMIDRLLFLRHNDVPIQFNEMVVVTFTNEAVSNMRDKLLKKLRGYYACTKDRKYLLWMEELRDMAIGTIHSFARRILPSNRKEYVSNDRIKIKGYRYQRRLLIEDSIDAYTVEYKDKFKEWLYVPQYEIVSLVEKILDHLDNLALDSSKIMDLSFGDDTKEMNHLLNFLVKNTYSKLNRIKNEEGYLDVNDLISELQSLYSASLPEEFTYKSIMIDEFQDTDRTQVAFFGWLSKMLKAPLFVVGDVKQSIYRFRGADYTAFEQIEELISNFARFSLQKNYRSNRLLIHHFNYMFNRWPKWVNGFLYKDRDHLKPIHDNDLAAVGLVKKNWHRNREFLEDLEEYQYNDTAILVRTNKEVLEIASILSREQIAFRTVQDGTFYRSLAVREFYLLIRRFLQPNVWKNRLALHLSSYGDRSTTILDVIGSYSSEKMYIEPLLSDLDPHLSAFADYFDKRPVFEVLEKLIYQIKPSKRYAERLYTAKREKQTHIPADMIEAEARTQEREYAMNLEKLLILLKESFRYSVPTLFAIERHLSISMTGNNTESILALEEQDQKRIKIMTVHKAKGLEFDYVFIPNTNKPFEKFTGMDVLLDGDNIGYSADLTNKGGIQNKFYQGMRREETTELAGEETRLLYVALTRAKKGAFVQSPDQTNNFSIRTWSDLIVKGSENLVSSPNIR
ncbi:UvrD-helicase domain-containing protein [Bacillus dakarensis]|uniref:UvrD-helicase domain-containing protein n=1 Tax=Robertmurraya dakarensis TaxID=1926278 RepID=UPI000981F588|nr:UvrD-helicase domain-containing protein [Bacillus dakarensis]